MKKALVATYINIVAVLAQKRIILFAQPVRMEQKYQKKIALRNTMVVVSNTLALICSIIAANVVKEKTLPILFGHSVKKTNYKNDINLQQI
jgi:hypothetical protein